MINKGDKILAPLSGSEFVCTETAVTGAGKKKLVIYRFHNPGGYTDMEKHFEVSETQLMLHLKAGIWKVT
jgi:hypothetical protein